MASCAVDAGDSCVVSLPGEQAERRAAGIKRMAMDFIVFTV
jgi:hypothetical protein